MLVLCSNGLLRPRDPFDYTPPRHSERRAKPEVEILRKQNHRRRNQGGVSLRMTARRYSESKTCEQVYRQLRIKHKTPTGIVLLAFDLYVEFYAKRFSDILIRLGCVLQFAIVQHRCHTVKDRFDSINLSFRFIGINQI